MKNLYYLASPYTDQSKTVRFNRFDAVCKVAAYLLQHGKLIYCPIAMSHPIVERGSLGTVYEDWKELDRRIITKCEGIYVLMLDGWDKSVGVLDEIAWAKKHNKAVHYLDPTDYL